MDGSALLAELGVTPDELAGAVRADVRDRTGCCASVGMGERAFACLPPPLVTEPFIHTGCSYSNIKTGLYSKTAHPEDTDIY